MAIVQTNELGKIDISEDVIATLAGAAALECYGIVGMVSRKALKDGLIELIGRENLKRGIVVHTDENKIKVDLYIIVGYGTKISEVAHNVQTRVQYTLKEALGIDVYQINIFVQGVKVV